MEPIDIRMGNYKSRCSWDIQFYHKLQSYALKKGLKWIRIEKEHNNWSVYSLTNPGLSYAVDEEVIKRFKRWLDFIINK